MRGTVAKLSAWETKTLVKELKDRRVCGGRECHVGPLEASTDTVWLDKAEI